MTLRSIQRAARGGERLMDDAPMWVTPLSGKNGRGGSGKAIPPANIVSYGAEVTEIRNLVKEFGERTLSNLDFVHSHKGQPGVYEVTQLWNSLSGLLVLPYEHEIDTIRASLAEAQRLGWPALVETFPLEYQQSSSADLADQIRRLRNAVSHYNVDFQSEHRTIVGVKVWNHQLPPRGSGLSQREMPVNWFAEVSLAQLDQLARATARLYATKLQLVA
jgi:hypothetical protein